MATPLQPLPPLIKPPPARRSKLIKVDYEVLPHVTDVDEALKPSAPVIHNDIFTEGVEPKANQAFQQQQRARLRPWRY